MKGKLIGLVFDGNFISCETNCTLDFEADELLMSPEEHGGWEEVMQGMKRWSITVDAKGFFDALDADFNDVFNAFSEGLEVDVAIQTRASVIQPLLLSGKVIVKSGSLNAPSKGDATWNVMLKGTGELKHITEVGGI